MALSPAAESVIATRRSQMFPTLEPAEIERLRRFGTAHSYAAGEERKALETSRNGVFAIGDVRAGSVKRVAAAVGEGAQVVATLHGFLAAANRAASAASA